MSQTEGIERILSKLVAWGTARDDLRAIAVVGSRARSDHPADSWSDLDVIVMARRPQRYLGESDWLAEIETPWLALREPTAIGGQQIFLLTFEGGTKVDLVFVSSFAFSLAARALATLRRHPFVRTLLPKIGRDRLTELSDVLKRGFRFVLDKDRLGDRRDSGEVAVAPPRPPSGVYHPTSTRRMGSDARAVVDPTLRVRGVDALWVVDTSVMPAVPRGHPNAVVAMISNRAAGWIEDDLSAAGA